MKQQGLATLQKMGFLIDDHDLRDTNMKYAGHTRKASRISKAAEDNRGKGVGNFYLS